MGHVGFIRHRGSVNLSIFSRASKTRDPRERLEAKSHAAKIAAEKKMIRWKTVIIGLGFGQRLNKYTLYPDNQLARTTVETPKYNQEFKALMRDIAMIQTLGCYEVIEMQMIDSMR